MIFEKKFIWIGKYGNQNVEGLIGKCDEEVAGGEQVQITFSKYLTVKKMIDDTVA